MKVIAIINQKGGVGKTTTALALGAGLSIKGLKALMCCLQTLTPITEPKATQKVKEPCTDHELAILLKKPNIKECAFAEHRAWAIINCLFATGNREGTASNIKIEDVKFESRIIHLKKTKNRKGQIMPLSPNLEKILKEYLLYRKGAPSDYLWGNQSLRKASLTTRR